MVPAGFWVGLGPAGNQGSRPGQSIRSSRISRLWVPLLWPESDQDLQEAPQLQARNEKRIHTPVFIFNPY